MAGVRVLLVLAFVASGSASLADTNSPLEADIEIAVSKGSDTCVVTKLADASNQAMPCRELVHYVREMLKLPSGASFKLIGLSRTNFYPVQSSLEAAGYRLAGLVAIGLERRHD